jgi:hypothetical protein
MSRERERERERESGLFALVLLSPFLLYMGSNDRGGRKYFIRSVYVYMYVFPLVTLSLNRLV